MQEEQRSEEAVIEASLIDERALEAKKSDAEMEKFIEDFKPYLHSRAARFSGRQNTDLHDELYSASMIALYEAVEKYDPARGHFFGFAEMVVRARILDAMRGVYRHADKEISLDSLAEEDAARPSAHTELLEKHAMSSYDRQKSAEALADEIEQFKLELASWSLSMEKLEKSSPKHRRLRETYKKLVSLAAENDDIIETVLLKRYFPVKKVAALSGLPEKTIERARVYVIASLIIKTGDYQLISGFIE